MNKKQNDILKENKIEVLLEEDDPTVVWHMKDGTAILPEQMTNTHLINTIKMLEKNKQKMANAHLNNMICGGCPNGDAATSSWENEFESAMEMENDPYLFICYNTPFERMVKEAVKRELQIKDYLL